MVRPRMPAYKVEGFASRHTHSTNLDLLGTITFAHGAEGEAHYWMLRLPVTDAGCKSQVVIAASRNTRIEYTRPARVLWRNVASRMSTQAAHLHDHSDEIQLSITQNAALCDGSARVIAACHRGHSHPAAPLPLAAPAAAGRPQLLLLSSPAAVGCTFHC